MHLEFKLVALLVLVGIGAATQETKNTIVRESDVRFTSRACIPAASLGHKEAYGVVKMPATGTVQKVIVRWDEGSVSFCSGTSTECQRTRFYLMGTYKCGLYITRSNPDEILFPRQGTLYYHGPSDTPGFYVLSRKRSDVNSLSRGLQLVGPKTKVTEGEEIRLYFGEVLKQVNYEDNSGTVCVTTFWDYRDQYDDDIRKGYVQANGVTCLPVVGAPKSAYGMAVPYRGTSRLNELTVTVISGEGRFCSGRRCSGGTFGVGNELAVYVTRKDGTMMCPIDGQTVGYSKSASDPPGFYRMSGNVGNGQSITFKLSQHQTLSHREMIKLQFGVGAQASSWGGRNGSVCVQVSGKEAGVPRALSISCRRHESFIATCSCGFGKCQTFTGYKYDYGNVRPVYLIRPAPPLGIIPFTVSAMLLGSARVEYVRIVLRLDPESWKRGLTPKYVEIYLFAKSDPTARRYSDAQATPLVDGKTNPYEMGEYVYSNIGGKLRQVDVLLKDGDSENGRLSVQLDPKGFVSVILNDCFKGHVLGMCGSFGMQDDKKLIKKLGANQFGMLLDNELEKVSNEKRSQGGGGSLNKDLVMVRGKKKDKIKLNAVMGSLACGVCLVGVCMVGLRIARRSGWDSVE